MKNKTHLVFGASSAFTAIYFKKTLLEQFEINNLFDSELFFIFVCIGSILPDIDVKTSWTSQLSPIPFYKILTHRKQTHNNKLIFSLFIFSIIFRNNFLIFSVSLGLFLGILLHVEIDKFYSKTRNDNYYCKYENPFFYISWIIIIIFLFLNILC